MTTETDSEKPDDEQTRCSSHGSCGARPRQMRLVREDDGSWRSWDNSIDDCMDNRESIEVREVADCDRKTIAVCTRFLPIGERDTAYMTVDESTTVGEINKWCDHLCQGKTVCVRLELVDQYRG